MNALKEREISIKGLPGSNGVVIGKVLVLDAKKKKVQPKKIKSDAIHSHLTRFSKAKQSFISELEELSNNLDQKTASILETQKHIASDIEIELKINTSIEVDQYAVDYAIFKIFNQFIERLKESGSELFQQRIVDIENIRDRLITISRSNQKVVEVEKGAILIVKDISPTDLVSYYEKGVKGLVMDKGGITSHAAIIAQSLDIPCIVSTKIAVHKAGLTKQAIIDGLNGELILDPSKETLAAFKKIIQKQKRDKKALKATKVESKTKDGTSFQLSANVEFVQELLVAKKYGAEGIGLLRTEALLYGGLAKKSEKEQNKFYNEVLSGSTGQVTIRLFDVGGDKLTTHTIEEDNPFLGWRGIRMLLDEKEMFVSQLRSILRTAGQFPGRIRLLVPMISVLEEVFEVKEAIKEVSKNLAKEGVKIDDSVPLGVMIEVPSAALLAHHMAKEVDFFSIGTNDLTQYTLAVDRGNEQICELYQQHHPSVWQLIKLTKDAADKQQIELSVCGELAGDELGAACLLGLGITDLSMSPSSIPKVKKMLINRSIQQLNVFSNQVLACRTTSEVMACYEEWADTKKA